MSLIKEALKVKTAEQHAPATASPTIPSPTATATTPPELPSEKKPASRNPKSALTAGICIIIMIALAGFGYSLIKKSFGGEKSFSDGLASTVAKIRVPLSAVERQKLLAKQAAENPQPNVETKPTTKHTLSRLLKKSSVPKKPAIWPPIELTGFGAAPDGRLAIINGKIMREGQSIGGAKIIAILEDKVIMECEGETLSFTSGSK